MEGIDLIEKSGLSFLPEIKMEQARLFSGLFHSEIGRLKKSLGQCHKFLSHVESGVNRQLLFRYIDTILLDLMNKSQRILTLLTECILDKAFEYQTLIYVLSLIGEMNMILAA
jgi:hypothetical protein